MPAATIRSKMETQSSGRRRAWRYSLASRLSRRVRIGSPAQNNSRSCAIASADG